MMGFGQWRLLLFLMETWYATVVVSIRLGFVYLLNDAEALLQDQVLVLRGVGARHDDVVAMDAGRDGMVRVFEYFVI